MAVASRHIEAVVNLKNIQSSLDGMKRTAASKRPWTGTKSNKKSAGEEYAQGTRATGASCDAHTV